MEQKELNDRLEKALPGLEEFIKGLDVQREQWKKWGEDQVAHGADIKDIRTCIDNAMKRFDKIEAKLGAPGGVDGSNAEPFTSLGAKLVSGEDFKQFADRATKTGTNARGPNFSMGEKTLFPEVKTTITEGAVGSSTPGILVPQRFGGIVKPGIRRIRVRDLMPRYPMGSNNAVEYVKESGYSNAASPQVEASAKSESGLTFTIASAAVRTLAHWIPASRQILDDLPVLQAYVDQRLLEGLKDVEDVQLLTGDGAGQNILGIIPQAGAYDTGRNVGLDTKIDKANHYISQIEDVNLYPTGFIMAPRDWRAIQLVKTEEGGANKGQYIMGGPAGNASPFLWGLPVATTTAMTAGKLICGDFEGYCAVWDRMMARIDVSTDYSDFFVKNLVAIRAEERLAFTLTRNDAVIQGDF